MNWSAFCLIVRSSAGVVKYPREPLTDGGTGVEVGVKVGVLLGLGVRVKVADGVGVSEGVMIGVDVGDGVDVVPFVNEKLSN